jgi:hypothetical protein
MIFQVLDHWGNPIWHVPVVDNLTICAFSKNTHYKPPTKAFLSRHSVYGTYILPNKIQTVL